MSDFLGIKKVEREIEKAFAQADGYKYPTEDRVLQFSYNKDGLSFECFCIFDGHGGFLVSDFLKAHTELCLSLMINENPKDPLQSEVDYLQHILGLTFDILNRFCISPELFKVKFPDEYMAFSKRNCYFKAAFLPFPGGSTAVVSIITKQYIISAVVGDSTALMFDSNGKFLHATDGHSLDDPVERDRIIQMGGIIVQSDCTRILDDLRRPGLNMSRAFGDFLYQKRGVISIPTFFVWDIQEGAYLALVSDSFEEVLCTDQLTGKQSIKSIAPPQEISAEIFNGLRETNFDLGIATPAIVTARVERFQFSGRYCGDNTSLILARFPTVETFSTVHEIDIQYGFHTCIGQDL